MGADCCNGVVRHRVRMVATWDEWIHLMFEAREVDPLEEALTIDFEGGTGYMHHRWWS